MSIWVLSAAAARLFEFPEICFVDLPPPRVAASHGVHPRCRARGRAACRAPVRRRRAPRAPTPSARAAHCRRLGRRTPRLPRTPSSRPTSRRPRSVGRSHEIETELSCSSCAAERTFLRGIVAAAQGPVTFSFFSAGPTRRRRHVDVPSTASARRRVVDCSSSTARRRRCARAAVCCVCCVCCVCFHKSLRSLPRA